MNRAAWLGIGLTGGAGLMLVARARARARNDGQLTGEISGLKRIETATRSETADTRLGVVFGKPLPRAIVRGGWGDGRPKKVGGAHYAIDLPARTGTPIYAATSGTVVWADARGDSTAGKYVVIEHSGVRTRYLHMSAVHVEHGDHVELGETIGLVGSTGFSSGPHLHLDVFVSDELLAAFRKQFGTPQPPFPKKRRWGTQVPAETLIPVNGYSTRVITSALVRGVKLRSIDALKDENRRRFVQLDEKGST